MSWPIKCDNCNKVTWVKNIVDLQDPEHGNLDEKGWVLCGHCGERGYIERNLQIPEEGTFDPHIKVFIRPDGYKESVYQPFAFLVSYSAEEPPEDAWFCYYKNMRPQGGKLSMRLGPVLKVNQVLDLVLQMIDRGCLDVEKILKAVRIAGGPDSN